MYKIRYNIAYLSDKYVFKEGIVCINNDLYKLKWREFVVVEFAERVMFLKSSKIELCKQYIQFKQLCRDVVVPNRRLFKKHKKRSAFEHFHDSGAVLARFFMILNECKLSENLRNFLKIAPDTRTNFS